MGKAKPAKHTAKELEAKAKASTVNQGGGRAGLVDRKGGQAGHAKFKCYMCGLQAPSLKNMEAHFEAKHAKERFEPDRCSNMHELMGATTMGVAVRGSTKKTKK